MSLWLTVVMPVHDGERYLGATLESAAANDTTGIQFRIYNSADDGGAARQIAESFAGRLDIVWTDAPALPSWQAKTNLGVEEASTAHVAMLHQDDLWLPGHADATRRAIAEHPGAALSIAATRFADAKGRIFGRWRLPFRPGPIATADFVQALLIQNSIAIPTPIVRRDSWLSVGGLDPQLWYTADWDVYLKLAAVGHVVVREYASTAFRLHGASLTMTGRRDIADFRLQLEHVLERHLDQAPISRRARIARRARASIAVNCALAEASIGRKAPMVDAALRLLRLGPTEIARYVHQSRIVDRLLPRLQLAMGGAL